jgi:hypothetical protein
LVSGVVVLCVTWILGDVEVAAVLSNTGFGRERELGEGVCVSAVPWFGYRRERC